ncbi:hypothetical protein OG819_50240 [Streptomyces sp. NBC_01549]|nr:hypothetical protein [Streptomyces sp. NBC_01549]MCX4597470.1 hypothetical protein [Streptomyces sp. NBC_01549]
MEALSVLEVCPQAGVGIGGEEGDDGQERGSAEAGDQARRQRA